MIAAKDLIVGNVYRCHNERKGEFLLRVEGVDGEWITGTVMQGVARAVMSYNVAYEGDSVTVRDCHSAFYDSGATERAS